MDNDQPFLKGHLPTLILAVLEREGRHGYGIAREVAALSENVLDFKEGSLYPALHGLERDGFIAGEWQTADNGRARKLYFLTSAGRTRLAESRQAWERSIRAMARVLGTGLFPDAVGGTP